MRAREEIMLRDERGEALAMYQQAQPFGPALPPELPEPSIFRGILRHFWLVILFGGLGAGGAYAFIKYARPLYTSECKIYIQPSSGPRVLAETLGSTQRSNYLYTQSELIKSTPILTILLDKEELKNLQTWQLSPQGAIEYLREELEADVDRKNDIISIKISSPYAEEAADIVNGVVQSYKDYQGMEKESNTTGVIQTLKDSYIKAETERKALAGRKLEFERTNPNLKLDQIFMEQLRVLAQQYTQAQLATITARGRFAGNHPEILAASQQEERFYNAYKEKLDSVYRTNRQLAEYQLLAADLTHQETLVKGLQDKLRELDMAKQQDQIFNMVQIMEPGRVAERPSFPRKTRTMAAAVVLGGLLGAGLALLRDRSDGRMRSVEEIQTTIGLPILGVVPAMRGGRTAVARAMTVHLDPRSVVAEAYRTIRTAVYFGTNGARCKTILVTSPEPGDGKTTSASNLAIAIAQTGRTVLLLDADFRKPSQHKNLDIKGSVGLSSVLAGHEALERAIQRTGVEGLDILPCGPIPSNPSEILNSREFGELVDTLASRYDHILFDSPPVNSVTDARILGAVCDASVLVLRADKSTRKSGEHARNALLGVGARVLGAVVNDAPSRKAYSAYGGTYYGTHEPGPRYPEKNGNGNGLRRLPTAVAEAAE